MPSITEVDNIKSLDDSGQTSILTKTGTGGSKVFTADNVTLGSSVVFPAGVLIGNKVDYIANAEISGTYSAMNNSTAALSTQGMSLKTFTYDPKSDDSYIYVQAHFAACENGNNENQCLVALFAGTTNISQMPAYYRSPSTGYEGTAGPLGGGFDNAATATITFDLRGDAGATNNRGIALNGRHSGSSFTSEYARTPIIIMEFAK